MKKNKKHVVISLSGGMDSSTLLLRCLKEYDTCTAISFDYGQKHRIELERAQSLVDYLNDGYNLDSINKSNYSFNYNLITYRQIQLNGLADLLDSALVTGGAEVPEGKLVGCEIVKVFFVCLNSFNLCVLFFNNMFVAFSFPVLIRLYTACREQPISFETCVTVKNSISFSN